MDRKISWTMSNTKLDHCACLHTTQITLVVREYSYVAVQSVRKQCPEIKNIFALLLRYDSVQVMSRRCADGVCGAADHVVCKSEFAARSVAVRGSSEEAFARR